MADVRTCCQCGAANLIANSPERCPICSHTLCSNCRTGRRALYPPPHPNTYHNASPANQSYHYSPTQHPSSSMASASRTPRYYTTNYPSSSSSYPPTATPHYHSSASGGYASARPDMRGWWVCCSCKQSWNPALAPERCPYDGHKKGMCCVVL